MPNNRFKLLIVEDEANILSFMEAIVVANGYQALTAQTGAQAKLMIASHCPDLMILDLGLPDMDGQALIQFTRASRAIPILVLSARTDERDKVAALDLGANDYITKPFGTAELLARVRAALRNARPGAVQSVPASRVELAQGLAIDYDKRQVSIHGQRVDLTQTEFNIVSLLCQHAGRVMTYSAIIRSVWGELDVGGVKKLQVNMANIRRKLGSRPGEGKYIANELGIGYRMLDAGDAPEETQNNAGEEFLP